MKLFGAGRRRGGTTPARNRASRRRRAVDRHRGGHAHHSRGAASRKEAPGRHRVGARTRHRRRGPSSRDPAPRPRGDRRTGAGAARIPRPGPARRRTRAAASRSTFAIVPPPAARCRTMRGPLRDALADSGTALIVNARPDIAAAISADGVQLGPGDLGVADARHVLSEAGSGGRCTASTRRKSRQPRAPTFSSPERYSPVRHTRE